MRRWTEAPQPSGARLCWWLIESSQFLLGSFEKWIPAAPNESDRRRAGGYQTPRQWHRASEVAERRELSGLPRRSSGNGHGGPSRSLRVPETSLRFWDDVRAHRLLSAARIRSPNHRIRRCWARRFARQDIGPFFVYGG